MSERFIKFIPSEESNWLMLNHGNAFILLSLIATRARRVNGNPDGLVIGDALIGSSDLSPGMSRQNFRTALNKLVEFGYVEIIANGKVFKKREKSTIKVTIKSTLVNLIKSTIYDINSEDGNQHSNQRLTNDQPTTNHKQERIRKNKNEEEEKHIAQTASQLRKIDEEIGFSFDEWRFTGITNQDMETWKEIYPLVDIELELKKMTEWNKDNPTKAKSRKNWRKFISGWLSRNNEREVNREAYKSFSTHKKHSEQVKSKDVRVNPRLIPFVSEA